MLFIVQDKSGSMNQPANPSCTNCPTKWTDAKNAVTQLVGQFSNRFRFGLALYPRDSATFNCTTGSVVSTVPATASQVQAAYNAATPGGGTSTAASLTAVRNHLQSLNLDEPAYVLLITDGLPNCNLGLNPNSCTASTPGCENNSCGLGAKDCLDNVATAAAAAALKNAGHKVYVVGFGSQATSANNLAVLNSVAAAGGTGSAYSANDQASLTAALNAIGYNASTCCKDACTAGTSFCTASGGVQTCKVDQAIGCTTWTTSPCAARSWCANGSCVACNDECTLGARVCNGSAAETCVVGPNGCTRWNVVDTCAFGETCSGGSCQTCTGCQPGETRCNGQHVEVCEQNPTTGCSAWKTNECTTGSVCATGSCRVCNNTCTQGAARCTGNVPETCVQDASGCTQWQAGPACSGFCSGGACGTCGNSCSVGDTRCNGSSIESCTTDVNGCSVWSTKLTCANDNFCKDGRCGSCHTTCEPGSRRCSASGIEQCQVDPYGCTTWAPLSTCGVDQSCVGGNCVEAGAEACEDRCTPGERTCTGEGGPLACEVGPAGCAVWVSQKACGLGEVCAEGVCGATCFPHDAFSCAENEECVDKGGTLLCLPVGSGGNRIVAGGCGCGATEPGALALLAFGTLALLGRRRRAR